MNLFFARSAISARWEINSGSPRTTNPAPHPSYWRAACGRYWYWT